MSRRVMSWLYTSYTIVGEIAPCDVKGALTSLSAATNDENAHQREGGIKTRVLSLYSYIMIHSIAP